MTIPGTKHVARVLRALGERQAKLRQDGALILESPKGEVAADARAVSQMVSEGLLSRVRGNVARTDAGRAYLRRALMSPSDNPAAEQHREPVARVIQDRGRAIHVTEDAGESPLAWLSQRKDRSGNTLITPTQREAGERLFCDFERGHQRQSVTASWDASGVRSTKRRDGLSVTEAAQDARRRVEAALKSAGPGLAETLVAVCCEGLGLETMEKRFGWPARSGKVVLRLALDRLAAHYGFSATASGGGSAGAILHWGAANYRPRA